MSVHDHSEALRSTQKHSGVWWNGPMSSHKCSLHHDIMLMSANECSRYQSAILMSVHGYLGLLSSVHGNSWLFMRAHKHSLLIMTLMTSHEHSWSWCLSAMNITEQPWVAINTHEHSTLAPWALISTHEHDIQVRWELMAPFHHTHECSWVLLSAHERSCTFMSADECLRTWSFNYWKMLILKINTL